MQASLSPERWEQIQRLFNEVVDLQGVARTSYLDEACRDDDTLRAEVESLLQAYEEADELLHDLEQIAAPPPDPQTDSASREGMRISHYDVLEKLGGGGMGVVYKARDIKLDRPVALKFLPPHLDANAAVRRRFVQEAKAASALDHNNICAIHEIGETSDGQLFIAMAYYGGETLKQKIRQGPVPLNEALDYAVQMAKGLERAHEAGIVHRDIKPANVMVTDRGVIKVLDFGLAKMADVKLTRSGTTMGTVAYMSPEQARGEQVDHRTDLWSLGVVLYEMLTGQLPFDGEYDQALIYALLHEQPQPVVDVNPAVPEDLSHVVGLCLEKDRDLRYPTMADLLADLEVFVQGSGTGPTMALQATRRRKGTRRWRVWAGIGVLAAALLLLLIPSVRHLVVPGGGRMNLAVLPFANVDKDPAHQPFIDGLVYTVTSTLTGMEPLAERLSVVPARDVMELGVFSTRGAADTLGVNLVVTGSVQRVGDEVVLTLDLLDARSGRQLRGKTLDGRQMDIAGVQTGIVQELADLLNVVLDSETTDRLVAGGTAAPRAYDFYTEGLGYLHRHENEANIDLAIGLFQQAISEDSLYTLAYAALGEAYLRKYGVSNDRQWIEEATRHGEHAIALDDDLAPVRVTMGMIYRGTGAYKKAETEFLRALALDSTSALAHQQIALAYRAQNQPDLAETYARKAIELKPNDWNAYNILAWLYYLQGRHQEAAEQYRQVVRLRPDNPSGFTNLGAQYERMGDFDEALVWYQRASQTNPQATRSTAMAYVNLAGIHYRKKHFADAVLTYEQARDIQPTNTLTWTYLANSYYWAGEREKAQAAWRRVIELDGANLEVNPNDATALDRLAEAYAKTGQKPQADSMLQRLAAIAPTDPTLLFSIARTYEYLGVRDSSLVYLEGALRYGLTLAYIDLHAVWLDSLRADARYEALVARDDGEP